MFKFFAYFNIKGATQQKTKPKSFTLLAKRSRGSKHYLQVDLVKLINS